MLDALKGFARMFLVSSGSVGSDLYCRSFVGVGGYFEKV